jgi:hypothetical protein
MPTSGPALWLAIAGGLALAGPGRDRQTPEARAVAFLVLEVPRWSRENHCYSCHNNGDAARALYEAVRAGYDVPAGALLDTTAWLSRPASWDRNGGDGPSSDKHLARLVFTSALTQAVRAGSIPDRSVLLGAAERLAGEQADDGSWPRGGADALGSPAAYGRGLATYLARDGLAAADLVRFRGSVARADTWLGSHSIATTTDASVRILATASMDSPTATARRRPALDLLRRGQGADGGWGPYVTSAPEPFDTALALLALSRIGGSDEIQDRVARGRGFLIARQQEDGGWVETTRPPGAESYAQRISTSGWATLALIATAGRSRAPGLQGTERLRGVETRPASISR